MIKRKEQLMKMIMIIIIGFIISGCGTSRHAYHPKKSDTYYKDRLEKSGAKLKAYEIIKSIRSK
ncbi:MAG: hypothetical protein PHS92_03355 [Candidatus Gracilibacteria bacterium]|nr:hypothetical protein [Candidatus Gracilibacteria bacterium]